MTASTDDSTRYVRPADSPLPANLAALWAVDPALAQAIDGLDDAEAYPTEPSRAGVPTLSRTTGDNRVIYLHSRHQPIDEARRLIESVAIDQKMTIYILGLGLGYHAELLFDQASDEALHLIFEPDPRMIRTAFESRDLSRLIRSGRVTFFTEADKARIFQFLTPHTALVSIGSEQIIHPPSRQLHPEFFSQIMTWLGEFAAFCRTNMNTLVLNSRKTAENIAMNIGWYAACPGLERLRNRYQGKPAVIVSAGPSLRKNKHLLKGLEDRALMIAVQTTLQPLLEMGIEPHFATSIDYHDICTRFFEKLPAGLRTELIAEPKASARIFSMYPGPVTLIGNDFAEQLAREMRIGKPSLTSGATVAHLAFYVAEYLGCDPIIFVGQDLGFSDGLCYTPGTGYEDVWRPELGRFCSLEMKQWEQIIRERPILRKIPDYRGRPMYTEERLFAYLHQFERDFAQSKSRIIDATEGGAFKRGSTPMPLAEAIERFCARPLENTVSDHAGAQWDRIEDCVSSIRNRLEETDEIEAISRKTFPLLREIRDWIEDQSRVNRAIAQVDELRARMDTLGATYDLIMQMSQETELRRFERDRRVTAEKVAGIDRQKKQIERDIANVEAVVEAAKDFRVLLREVMARLTRAAGADRGRSSGVAA